MSHSSSKSLLVFLLLLSGISVFYLSGVAGVPFHPDESTQLFTSGDVEIFFKQPAAVFWQAGSENDARQRYRELDAPLTHYIIAAGRWIAGQPALPVDWDWGKTWQENRLAGALPSPALLLAGRMAVAALFPFSVLFLFLAARRVAGDFTAWVAALLLACNALVLLHTRRSMAEGALLFTLTLSLWSLVKAEQRPWLTAVPMALAFCAKQLLGALGLAGLLAAFWPVTGERSEPGGSGRTGFARLFQQHLSQPLLFGAVFVAIIFLMNPFLWKQPIPAMKAAIQNRQALANAQAADRPDQVLNTPARRLIGLIGSVYLTPPQFAETGNYLDSTRAAEAAYLADPLHSLFRSLPAGAILLVAGLFGFAVSALQAARPGHPARRGLILLMAATLFQALALLATLLLPWQRYYLPLVPYACLWAGFGIEQIKELVFCATTGRRGMGRG